MKLKELRKAKDLTQSEAAAVAGVSLESYKHHELGSLSQSITDIT